MKRIKSWFETLPLAPFALPILIILPLMGSNRYRLIPGDAMGTLIALTGLTFVAYCIIYFALRDNRRAALITLLLSAYLLYAPTLADFAGNWHWLAIGILGLLAIDTARRLPKERHQLRKAMLLSNLAVTALAFPSIIITTAEVLPLELARPDPNDVFPQFEARADNHSPDVWHIVMDRYANADVLKNDYSFDNQSFLRELESRGFAVENASHSNYQVTHQSLASTLNAQYLDALVDIQTNELDWVPFFHAVREDQAKQFFKSQGYEVLLGATWANITAKSALADRVITARGLSEIPRTVLSSSLPGRIGSHFGLPFFDGRIDQCFREAKKFLEFQSIAAEAGRKYVLAHFLIPHPPYVFSVEGECKSRRDEEAATRTDNYIGQVKYANRELLLLIDAILAGPRPATIVLQGDEGPYPAEFALDEEFHSTPLLPAEKWKEASAEKWREKTGILMAVRHAYGDTKFAPRSPINLYPIILNRDFNGTAEMLDERIYIFRDTAKPNEFTDVTQQIIDK